MGPVSIHVLEESLAVLGHTRTVVRLVVSSYLLIVKHQLSQTPFRIRSVTVWMPGISIPSFCPDYWAPRRRLQNCIAKNV